MIVEYIRYRIEPSQATAFLSAYETASKSLRASSHCFGYELSQCTDARESYTLIERIDEMRHYEFTSIRWSRA